MGTKPIGTEHRVNPYKFKNRQEVTPDDQQALARALLSGFAHGFDDGTHWAQSATWAR